MPELLTKLAPARRRPKAKPPGPPKGHIPMTLDVKLAMTPVYELLEREGFDWQRIPECEFATVVGIWRRDRMARGMWAVDWQPDGENFVLLYAKSHHWDDEEVVDRMNVAKATRKPGDLTEAQRDSMSYLEYVEWEARQCE